MSPWTFPLFLFVQSGRRQEEKCGFQTWCVKSFYGHSLPDTKNSIHTRPQLVEDQEMGEAWSLSYHQEDSCHISGKPIWTLEPIHFSVMVSHWPMEVYLFKQQGLTCTMTNKPKVPPTTLYPTNGSAFTPP